MKKEDFCEVLGDIRDDYVKGAREHRKENHTRKWVAWGAAACACLILGGALLLHPPRGDAPNPDRVQIASPILGVESVEEMERTLDFPVPVLDKAVDAYIVLVIDGYPESARIQYADQTTFNMKYGSGDISGIYGGTLEKEEESNDNNMKGLQFVITGSVNHFANRNEMKALIESRGGKVTGTVSSKTDYLINNDNTSNSSKNKKAKELNIPVLTEEEFLSQFVEIFQ